MSIQPLSDLTRRYFGSTTEADYRPSDEWFQPTFQYLWLNDLWLSDRSTVDPMHSGILQFSTTTDTAPISSYLALSRQTSSGPVSFARSLAARLRTAVNSIDEWVEDREYESLFRQEGEPTPTRWVKQLARFKNGPEIPLRWDDDE